MAQRKVSSFYLNNLITTWNIECREMIMKLRGTNKNARGSNKLYRILRKNYGIRNPPQGNILVYISL